MLSQYSRQQSRYSLQLMHEISAALGNDEAECAVWWFFESMLLLSGARLGEIGAKAATQGFHSAPSFIILECRYSNHLQVDL